MIMASFRNHKTKKRKIHAVTPTPLMSFTFRGQYYKHWLLKR